MTSNLKLDVPAMESGLRSCVATIEDSCTAWKLGREITTRITLAVEELFSNTIKYGYARECELPVRIRLRVSPEIELVYEDEAPPFDPIAWLDATQRAAPELPDLVGRKGIVLVVGMARSSRYEQLSSGNRLILRFG